MNVKGPLSVKGSGKVARVKSVTVLLMCDALTNACMPDPWGYRRRESTSMYRILLHLKSLGLLGLARQLPLCAALLEVVSSPQFQRLRLRIYLSKRLQEASSLEPSVSYIAIGYGSLTYMSITSVPVSTSHMSRVSPSHSSRSSNPLIVRYASRSN